MSQNSHSSTDFAPKVAPRFKPKRMKQHDDKQKHEPTKHKWSMLFALPVVVVAAFIGAQLVLFALLWVLKLLGISLTAYFASSIIETVLAAASYVLAFSLIIGAAYLFKRRPITLELLGLTRLMNWTDIGLSLVGFIAYFVLAALVLWFVSALFPGFPMDQTQDVGFKNLTDRTGYILAFVTLVVVAPVAEEVLFRGFLYGKLKAYVPMWAAILMTSIVFGAVHGQWNVGVNVFALSIILCGLRELTGSIWAGILLHMLKNGIAFYILFIGPLVSPALGA